MRRREHSKQGHFWSTSFDFARFWQEMRQVFCVINPFSWSERAIKVVFALIVSVVLPVYLYIGLQPRVPAEAASYPVLKIDEIGLETPVEPLELEGRQLNVPDIIAGSYSSETNKILLVGHSSTVFKDLKQLKTGQEIVYDSRAYQVVSIETLAKSDISMKKILAGSTENTLVLMTCAGESLPNQDATHRLIITTIAK